MSRAYVSIVSLLALLVSSITALAQTPRNPSYTVSLNQDSFFGFYPTVNGTVPLGEKADWTFYGIFWTTPSFGTGGGGGLWTEFGTGVNLRSANGVLTANPQVGVLNGKLLSNGAFPVFVEGIVPSLTVNLSSQKWEGQFYMGYYAALRKGKIPSTDNPNQLIDAPVQNNFLHWWVNAGYKVSSVVSLGAHYEHLRSNPSVGEASDLYKWFGPYLQATMSNGLTLRFSGGPNVLDRPAADGNNSFYKMTAAFSF
jgi:hypothetical protein